MLTNDFGTTAILYVTTHGNIYKEEDKDVDTFIVPEGMTIKRAQISTPGEVCMYNDYDMDAVANFIESFLPRLINDNNDIQNEAINEILMEIKQEDAKDLLNKRKFLGEFSKKQKREPLTQSNLYEQDQISRYVRQFEKGFRFSIFNSGDRIINKTYTRTNSEITQHNNVIQLLNFTGEPDLFSMLRNPSEQDDSIINLEIMVAFLEELNIKNIIIFDFSCSTILLPTSQEISQRELRQVRRGLGTLGGKRIKNKSIKNKSIKNKRIKKRRTKRIKIYKKKYKKV